MLSLSNYYRSQVYWRLATDAAAERHVIVPGNDISTPVVTFTTEVGATMHCAPALPAANLADDEPWNSSDDFSHVSQLLSCNIASLSRPPNLLVCSASLQLRRKIRQLKGRSLACNMRNAISSFWMTTQTYSVAAFS